MNEYSCDVNHNDSMRKILELIRNPVYIYKEGRLVQEEKGKILINDVESIRLPLYVIRR